MHAVTSYRVLNDMICRNKRAERGLVSLFGYDNPRGIEAFMYVTCGRENKSCVVNNRGENSLKTSFNTMVNTSDKKMFEFVNGLAGAHPIQP